MVIIICEIEKLVKFKDRHNTYLSQKTKNAMELERPCLLVLETLKSMNQSINRVFLEDLQFMKNAKNYGTHIISSILWILLGQISPPIYLNILVLHRCSVGNLILDPVLDMPTQ